MSGLYLSLCIVVPKAVWPSGLGHWCYNPEVLAWVQGLYPVTSGSPEFKSLVTLCKKPKWSISRQLEFLTKLCLFEIFVSFVLLPCL